MLRPLASLLVFYPMTLLLASPASAAPKDIYMGTDNQGVLTFTDSPPGGDDGFSIFLKILDGRPTDWAKVDPLLLRDSLDRYDDIIVTAARTHRVPPELVKAMVLVESGMNPKALSPRGAQGLMQLMPGTARELGVDDAYDPHENVFGGALYIRKMMDRFPNRKHAIAAYNAGPGNVRKYGGIPPFTETRYYVEKVLRYYAHFLSERPLSQ